MYSKRRGKKREVGRGRIGQTGARECCVEEERERAENTPERK
jgi:hypothetical protein